VYLEYLPVGLAVVNCQLCDEAILAFAYKIPTITMKPNELVTFLDQLVSRQIKISTMIWGAPGIGKSSIVTQTAAAHNIGFIDVRLSQLAPTDLRGLPVAENGLSRWYPPEFLPQSGHGILFLDEINLAPPTMQGMAQQLILDRRVGGYVVPEGWFIWAAGNRKEDRAIVFDMPAPLANRFIHLDVEADLDSFKHYALTHKLHEHIIAFVLFRASLLHKFEPQQPAWPSPRTWEMASLLHKAGLNVAPAIGNAAATEFNAFVCMLADVPDIEQIMNGEGAKLVFPVEPSLRYALIVGLVARIVTVDHAFHSFKWLTQVAAPEWVQMFAIDMLQLMRTNRKYLRQLQYCIANDAQMADWMDEYHHMIESAANSMPEASPTVSAEVDCGN